MHVVLLLRDGPVLRRRHHEAVRPVIDWQARGYNFLKMLFSGPNFSLINLTRTKKNYCIFGHCSTSASTLSNWHMTVVWQTSVLTVRDTVTVTLSSQLSKTLTFLFTDTLPQPKTSSQCFCISLDYTLFDRCRSHILVHFLPKSSMFITWTRRYFCNRQILDSFGETVKQGSTSQFDIFCSIVTTFLSLVYGLYISSCLLHFVSRSCQGRQPCKKPHKESKFHHITVKHLSKTHASMLASVVSGSLLSPTIIGKYR